MPVIGRLGTRKRFEPPSPEEGFEAIYGVRLGADGFEDAVRLS